MTKKRPVWLRVTVGIGVVVIIAAGILILFFRGSPFICLFYTLTHLYCPGCGSGRAATALVRLDFIAAIRNNVLFVVYIPPCAYYCLKQYIRFVFERDLLPWRDPPRWLALVITGSFVLFWILRNIPAFPFTLLAPIPID